MAYFFSIDLTNATTVQPFKTIYLRRLDSVLFPTSSLVRNLNKRGTFLRITDRHYKDQKHIGGKRTLLRPLFYAE